MIKEIVLGAVQGVTEFLPISSDGHLVLVSAVFGDAGDLFYITLLHVGTLSAATLYFFPKILEYLKDRAMILKVLLACFITGSIALVLKHLFELAFESTLLTAWCLCFNGLMLVSVNHYLGRGTKQIGFKEAVIMGLAQALAPLPGISRSGTTISALAFCGVKKEDAFAFSFISSLPLIVAAFALECKSALKSPHGLHVTAAQLVGVAVSFVVGLFALKLLELVIKKTRFDLLGYYCVVVGVFSVIMQVAK